MYFECEMDCNFTLGTKNLTTSELVDFAKNHLQVTLLLLSLDYPCEIDHTEIIKKFKEQNKVTSYGDLIVNSSTTISSGDSWNIQQSTDRTTDPFEATICGSSYFSCCAKVGYETMITV